MSTRKLTIKKQRILVDSCDRDYTKYPSSSTYTIVLPTTYKNVLRARIISLEVPASYYIFSAYLGNTTIGVTLYTNLGKKTANLPEQYITVPDGNYTVSSLVSTLQTLLNANTLFQTQGVTFTVSMNNVTLTLSISVTLGRLIEIDTTSLITDPVNWGLAYNLGFQKGVSYVGNTVFADNIINVNPFNYIVMEIENLNSMDECQSPMLVGNRYTNGSVKSFFKKVPMSVNSFDIVFHESKSTSLDETTFMPYIPKLDRLTIKWRFQ